MNPAIHAATHAAAAQRQLLITTLQKAGATSRDKAVARNTLASDMEAQIKYYLDRDLIRATADGALYINQRAYEDHMARMKTVGKWFLAVFGAAALLGILFLVSQKFQLL